MNQQQTTNVERRTPNAGEAAELSALEVGCWVLDVSPVPEEIKSKKTIKIKNQGFTLIEILLAVGIFAIVLFAMNTVFFSALRLERATTRAVDARQPLNQAFATLRRDLLNAVQPLTNSTLLPRNFISGGRTSGLGSAQAGSLEFYTATGLISDDAPWGDVQKVRYELVPAANPTASQGQELVRVVTRNILATTTEDEEEQMLMGDVESVEFLCYNGTDWRTTWDTSAGDTGLPLAMRIRVQLAPENPGAKISREPIELFVPITTVALTNSLAGGAQ
jgi:type II secretion system protein J